MATSDRELKSVCSEYEDLTSHVGGIMPSAEVSKLSSSRISDAPFPSHPVGT